MKRYALNKKRLRLVAVYSLLSAAFWLYIDYPWLFGDPDADAFGVVVFPPKFVSILEIGILASLSIAAWFGRRFAIYLATAIFLIKLLIFGLIHTIYASPPYSYNSLSLLRLGIWFMITDSLWHARESSILK